MIKGILGSLAGFAVMYVVIFSLLTAAYFALGTEGVFQAGNFKAAGGWVAAWFAVHLIGAAIAGFICRLISKSGRAALIFAAAMLGLGLILGVFEVLNPKSSGPRAAGDLPMFEAIDKIEQPAWLIFLTPFVVAAGIYAGGGLKKDGRVEG